MMSLSCCPNSPNRHDSHQRLCLQTPRLASSPLVISRGLTLLSNADVHWRSVTRKSLRSTTSWPPCLSISRLEIQKVDSKSCGSAYPAALAARECAVMPRLMRHYGTLHVRSASPCHQQAPLLSFFSLSSIPEKVTVPRLEKWASRRRAARLRPPWPGHGRCPARGPPEARH